MRLQESLRSLVVVAPLALQSVRTVGGIDVGYLPRRDTAHAACVVLSYPDLEPIVDVTVSVPVSFPYVPGLLAFREIPPVLAALEQLEELPDVWLVDGHGLAHPRRFGLACHLGVLLDRPVVGCAKKLFVGTHTLLGREGGEFAILEDGAEMIGAAVRTRTGVRPVYISIGHRVDLSSAIELVLGCADRYRIPEPLRRAHQLATRIYPQERASVTGWDHPGK
jgi:deoxyribonuclease V